MTEILLIGCAKMGTRFFMDSQENGIYFSTAISHQPFLESCGRSPLCPSSLDTSATPLPGTVPSSTLQSRDMASLLTLLLTGHNHTEEFMMKASHRRTPSAAYGHAANGNQRLNLPAFKCKSRDRNGR